MDNYLQWVIFNSEKNQSFGEPGLVPIPELFLSRLFARACYWSKHYPGDIVYLVFHLFDTNLSQGQINNINAAIKEIPKACVEFKNIKIVNFEELSDKVHEVIKLGEYFDSKASKTLVDSLGHLNKHSLVLKKLISKETQDIKRLKAHKGTFVDHERYFTLANFPLLRMMLGTKASEINKPVLYTDFDVVLNTKIDVDLFDDQLIGGERISRGISKINNNFILAKFDNEGVNDKLFSLLSLVNTDRKSYYAHYGKYWKFFCKVVDKAFSSAVITESIMDTMGSNAEIVNKYTHIANLLDIANSATKTSRITDHEKAVLEKALLQSSLPTDISSMEDISITTSIVLRSINNKLHRTYNQPGTYANSDLDSDLDVLNNILEKYDKSNNSSRRFL